MEFGVGHVIRFRCKSCNKKIGVPDEYAGKAIKCPQCAQPGRVPSVEESLASSGSEKTAPPRRVTPTKPTPPNAEEPDPLAGLRALEPTDVPSKKIDAASDSYELDADPLAALASAPLTEKPCRTCTRAMPLSATVCPHCGTTAVRPQPPTRPAPAHETIASATLDAERTGVADILHAPFTAPAFASAWMLTSRTAIASIALTIIPASLELLGLPEVACCMIVLALPLLIWFYLWFGGHLLGIVQRFHADQHDEIARVGGMHTFAYFFVVTLLAMAPVVGAMVIAVGGAVALGSVSHATGGGAGPSIGGSIGGGLLIGLGYLWAALYSPMGIAVAAAYDSINPIRVFSLILQTLHAYVLVFVFGVVSSFILAVGAVAVMLVAATAHMEKIAGIVLHFVLMFPSLWITAGIFAMMGTLLRWNDQRQAA